MTPERYNELNAICAAASREPWEYVRISPCAGMTRATIRTPWGLPVANWRDRQQALEGAATLLRFSTAEYQYAADEGSEIESPFAEAAAQEFADLQFIVAARKAVPEFLAEIKRLQRLVPSCVLTMMACRQCKLGVRPRDTADGLCLDCASAEIKRLRAELSLCMDRRAEAERSV